MTTMEDGTGLLEATVHCCPGHIMSVRYNPSLTLYVGAVEEMMCIVCVCVIEVA